MTCAYIMCIMVLEIIFETGTYKYYNRYDYRITQFYTLVKNEIILNIIDSLSYLIPIILY